MIKEFDTSKKLRTVNYTIDHYKLIWTPQDAKNLKLQLSGKVAATGGEFGDFNVAYDNTNSPFFVKYRIQSCCRRGERCVKIRPIASKSMIRIHQK